MTPTVSRLQVQNVRAHERFLLDVSPNVTVITGDNGSGKTSLLEALYIALRGSSFKGSDKEVLRHEADWWRIDLAFDDESARSVKFDPTRSSGKKQFVVNSKTSYRLNDKDKLPVVLFEPDDLRLLHGSPARRRLFIDRFISQIDPQYALSIRRYERALLQRNKLLKKDHVGQDELFAWNVSLSEYGAYILERRVQFVEQINSRLNDEYQVLAKNSDQVAVHYSHTLIGDTKTRLLGELDSHLARDQLLGYTSVGPHRHDIVFMFNNFPALSVASRGEVRSIMLALKLIEVDIITDLIGLKPIILLDDVYSELDINRQQNLSSILSNQIIITSTADAGVGDKVVKL